MLNAAKWHTCTSESLFHFFWLLFFFFILSCTYFQRTSSCSLIVPSSVISTMIAWGLVVKKFMLSHVTTPTRIVASPRSSVTCRDKYPFLSQQIILRVMCMERQISQAQICSEAHNKLKTSILMSWILNCCEPIIPQGICHGLLTQKRRCLGHGKKQSCTALLITQFGELWLRTNVVWNLEILAQVVIDSAESSLHLITRTPS